VTMGKSGRCGPELGISQPLVNRYAYIWDKLA